VTLSKTKIIALLATEGTIASEALDDYIKPYITTTKIIKVNASPMIDLVESGKFLEDADAVKQVIIDDTASIKSNPKTDIIILGSTHLPLIKEHIAGIYPKMQFVDPAITTVKQVKTFLQNQDITAQNKGGMQILVSKNKQSFEKIVRSLGILDKIEEVNLDFKFDVF
ncbi:MAG: glutamate racemase, partial [Nitrososphaerales archaeon]